MKPIVLEEEQWLKLRHHLFQTQPRSVMLTRWKMREVLGFTDRLHTEWIANKPNRYGGMGYTQRQIHLDFYDEAKRTFFLLKYTDWLNNEDSNNQ
jgi:hypothetical protein